MHQRSSNVAQSPPHSLGVFGVKCIILTVGMCCSWMQQFIWWLMHRHPHKTHTHTHTFQIFNKNCRNQISAVESHFNRHAEGFISVWWPQSTTSELICQEPQSVAQLIFISALTFFVSSRRTRVRLVFPGRSVSDERRSTHTACLCPFESQLLLHIYALNWFSFYDPVQHSSFFPNAGDCLHISDSLLPSCLQRSAAAIQEVPSMAARWATASTWTTWSASFAIRAMKWRGPHMLSARPTASGATRLQRVKVGKKVKCITPNFTYVKP